MAMPLTWFHVFRALDFLTPLIVLVATMFHPYSFTLSYLQQGIYLHRASKLGPKTEGEKDGESMNDMLNGGGGVGLCCIDTQKQCFSVFRCLIEGSVRFDILSRYHNKRANKWQEQCCRTIAAANGGASVLCLGKGGGELPP